jgi:hypothetical protein
MSAFELILIVLVAVGAFWAGYQIGRASVLSSPNAKASPPPVDTDDGELLPGPHAMPSRPRAAPPPASAGGDRDDSQPEGSGPPRNIPPRRSTTPPPASAGLMDKGGAEHSPKKSG